MKAREDYLNKLESATNYYNNSQYSNAHQELEPLPDDDNVPADIMPIVHYIMGLADKAKGEYDQAKMHLENAIESSSDVGDNQLMVVAISELSDVIAKQGHQVVAKLLQQNAQIRFDKLSKIQQSEQLFERVVKSSGKSPILYRSSCGDCGPSARHSGINGCEPCSEEGEFFKDCGQSEVPRANVL